MPTAAGKPQTTETDKLPPPPQLDCMSKKGFPSFAQYIQIESAYLDSLSPVKRSKALISQDMFDEIWDVLNYPDSRIGTPQFRFWVRKMFTLSALREEATDDPVVLHLGLRKPVAIKEQIYDLLCYCHSLANHAGRDKTTAIVREHYSWVPKQLISTFVKACPTCALVRSNDSKLTATVRDQFYRSRPKGMERIPGPIDSSPARLRLGLPHQNAGYFKDCDRVSGNDSNWPPNGGPLDAPAPRNGFSELANRLPSYSTSRISLTETLHGWGFSEYLHAHDNDQGQGYSDESVYKVSSAATVLKALSLELSSRKMPTNDEGPQIRVKGVQLWQIDPALLDDQSAGNNLEQGNRTAPTFEAKERTVTPQAQVPLSYDTHEPSVQVIVATPTASGFRRAPPPPLDINTTSIRRLDPELYRRRLSRSLDSESTLLEDSTSTPTSASSSYSQLSAFPLSATSSRRSSTDGYETTSNLPSPSRELEKLDWLKLQDDDAKSSP